jgi:DNA-binding PadR family transcriptional regulator
VRLLAIRYYPQVHNPPDFCLIREQVYWYETPTLEKPMVNGKAIVAEGLRFHVIRVFAESGLCGTYGYSITRKLSDEMDVKLRMQSVYKEIAWLVRHGHLERCPKPLTRATKYAGPERQWYHLTEVGEAAFWSSVVEAKQMQHRLNVSLAKADSIGRLHPRRHDDSAMQ